MTRTRITTLSTALLLATASLSAATEASTSHSRAQVRAIEGVWLPMVTLTDCQSQVVITAFPSMDLYIRGGGLVAFGAVKQSDQIGMGAWQHVNGRNYKAEYQFFNYAPFGAPDGTPDGTLLRVTTKIRLSADNTTFTATDRAVVVDQAGHVLSEICGHREAIRLQ